MRPTVSTAKTHQDEWTSPKNIPNWNGVYDETTHVPITPPPSESVRWVAEWEDMEGVLMAWPYFSDVLNVLAHARWSEIFCRMVNELQEIGVVYMLYVDESQRMEIRCQLILHGVPLTNIEWINFRYNTIWTRDYGPQNIWGQESGDWGIVDFRYPFMRHWDNNINPKLHVLWNTDYYSSSLVTEGGNLCPDGMGRVFCTNWILQENVGPRSHNMSEEEVRLILREYLNVELFILPQPPISPHLDMCAKLVDPETWIVGEWPADDPNTPYMDKLVGILENMTASTGNPYKIYRIQQPNRLKSGYWRTYTNAYMENGKVLVPIYGVEQDNAALAVYQQALPGWKIIGIDCTVYDGTGGAIHCSTDGIVSHDQISLLYSVLKTEDIDVQARNSSDTWTTYKSIQGMAIVILSYDPKYAICGI